MFAELYSIMAGGPEFRSGPAGAVPVLDEVATEHLEAAFVRGAVSNQDDEPEWQQLHMVKDRLNFSFASGLRTDLHTTPDTVQDPEAARHGRFHEASCRLLDSTACLRTGLKDKSRAQ